MVLPKYGVKKVTFWFLYPPFTTRDLADWGYDIYIALALSFGIGVRLIISGITWTLRLQLVLSNSVPELGMLGELLSG